MMSLTFKPSVVVAILPRVLCRVRSILEQEAINGVNIPKSQRWLLEVITLGRE